jgi:hypothetical protein
MARQRRKKQTRLVQSHLAVFLERSLKARTRPPVSDGEMVFSSTKITPPCFRSSSPQALSNGGMVLRSYVTNVNPCAAACCKQAESCCPKNSPCSHSAIQETTSRRLRRRRPSATAGEICSSSRSLSIFSPWVPLWRRVRWPAATCALVPRNRSQHSRTVPPQSLLETPLRS